MASAKKGKEDCRQEARESGSEAKAAKLRGGISTPVTVSAELAGIIGASTVTRAELTKRIWDYIKKNKLQDAKNRRNINADAKLQADLRRQGPVSMFEMTKLVNKHVK